MTKDEIRKKIDELEAKKQQVVMEINRVLGDIEGRIAVYKELLEEEDVTG